MPSLYDSNSMVALSVSISANTSPLVTLSPSFLCQPAITPSVMVSLKRGINTTSSIVLTSILILVLFVALAVVFIDVLAAGVAVVVLAVEVAVASGELSAAEAPFVFAAISAVMSSPCFPKMANKSFTCNLPPRGVPICNKIPS